VGEHFHAGMDYQDKLARFLENHDEPRAAAAFPLGVREAAAVITFLSPGLRFFHQGQFEGRKERISPHLCRGPIEPVDQELEQFYARLLAVLRQPVVRDGRWQLLDCIPARDGNPTHDCFLAFAWQGPGAERLLVAVNYAPKHSQRRVRLPFMDLGKGQSVAATGFARHSQLRPGRQRAASPRLLPGPGSLAVPCLCHDQDRVTVREDHHLENSLTNKAFTLPQVVSSPPPAAGLPLPAPAPSAALSSAALRQPA
jgi:hypothetical protein